MKRLALALALWLLPSLAFAQCTGVFPSNTICGNLTGVTATPKASTLSALPITSAQLDTLLGSTKGMVAVRGVSVWAGFPNGTGVFTNDGAGNISWVTAGTGTVTSVSVTAGTGITQSGSPVTTSGAITVNIDKATTSNIWAGTSNKTLEAGNVFNAAGALQSCGGTSSSVVCDFSTGFNFTFTATTATNYTLANPTNPKVGQMGCIYLIQPGSGSVVTIAYGTNWFTPGGVSGKALTATLGAIDRVCYFVRTTTFIDFSLATNVSH